MDETDGNVAEMDVGTIWNGPAEPFSGEAGTGFSAHGGVQDTGSMDYDDDYDWDRIFQDIFKKYIRKIR